MRHPQVLLLLSLLPLSLAQYPSARGPSRHENYCTVTTEDKYVETCVPTLLQECEKEATRNGKLVVTSEECYKVTRTICHEDEQVENNEVCAVHYEDQPVQAEFKTVKATFATECKDEETEICPEDPNSYQKCYKTYQHVCYKSPVLETVVKKVTLHLPQPVRKCINTPIHLTDIECKQVEERDCLLNPKATEGEMVYSSKCTVKLGDQDCQETVVQLPRQGCPTKITNVENIYEYIEQTAYSPALHPATYGASG